jgi:hypothetical protein
MRRGMAGRGSSDRAPIAVTQRGEADVKAAMRAQGSRDRPNVLRLCQSGDRGVGWASARECHPTEPTAPTDRLAVRGVWT